MEYLPEILDEFALMADPHDGIERHALWMDYNSIPISRNDVKFLVAQRIFDNFMDDARELGHILASFFIDVGFEGWRDLGLWQKSRHYYGFQHHIRSLGRPFLEDHPIRRMTPEEYIVNYCPPFHRYVASVAAFMCWRQIL